MDESTWMDIRAESHLFAKQRIEKLLSEFFQKIECPAQYSTIGYKFRSSPDRFIITTKVPGMMIGKGGKNVDLLQQMLKEEYHKDFKIEFKEVDDFFYVKE